MKHFKLTVCCIVFLLVSPPTYGGVLIGGSLPDAQVPNSPNATYYPDAQEPSHLLSYIHEVEPRESFIHHLSLSLLSVTKELLSFTPRAGRSNENEPSLQQKLETLRNLQPYEVINLLSEHGIVMPPQQKIYCDANSQFYRTLDGSCNNLEHACWGKVDEPYQRWLPPAYSNGVDQPRSIGKHGTPLPSPRKVYHWVSSQLEQTTNTTYPGFTNLIVTWGQMIVHDMLLTPTTTIKVFDGKELKNEVPDCCPLQPGTHKECIPIVMDSDDEDGFFPHGHCMSIVRSVANIYSPFSCEPFKLGLPREQMNQLSAFIDASIVYGVKEQQMRNIREDGGNGAKLILDYSSGWSTLPRKNSSTRCKTSHNVCDNRCFLTGEKRANENPILSAFHIIWAREHNRLVDALQVRRWPQETLFHVVRKIVGALMQHITYKEYLPLILGSGMTNWMNLNVPTRNYHYDPTINPTLYNVFVTAAGRFGHSMVNKRNMRAGMSLAGSPILSRDFFSVDDFCSPHGDPAATILYGQLLQKVQKVDCLFSKQLTNHLFAKQINGPGLDLFSVNIQRGRDHGIPPYNEWRTICGLPKVNDYLDLRGILPDYVIERLAAVYGPGRVDDVDLYVAGISEFPVNGGVLGPTFSCIVSNQYRTLKFGDRFWYENTDHLGGFSRDQINSIQRTSLASLICRNTNLAEIQRRAFITDLPDNPKVPCDVITRETDIDFSLWP